jgi:hypothetical protein
VAALSRIQIGASAPPSTATSEGVSDDISGAAAGLNPRPSILTLMQPLSGIAGGCMHCSLPIASPCVPLFCENIKLEIQTGLRCPGCHADGGASSRRGGAGFFLLMTCVRHAGRVKQNPGLRVCDALGGRAGSVGGRRGA